MMCIALSFEARAGLGHGLHEFLEGVGARKTVSSRILRCFKCIKCDAGNRSARMTVSSFEHPKGVFTDDPDEVPGKMNGLRATEFLMAIIRTANEFDCFDCRTASSIGFAVTRVFHQIALL